MHHRFHMRCHGLNKCCGAGEVLGCYVPQAVVDKDGRVLDIDQVLSEAVIDGGELVVEYGPGPLAFKSRWVHAAQTPAAGDGGRGSC
jgi:hypothetical protein